MRTILISGNIKSAKGNFTVTASNGETFFLHAKKAEGKTIDGAWASIISKTYNKVDAQGKPTSETFTRLEVAALFPSKAAALEAATAEQVFAIESAALVQTAATAAGLSQTAIDALLEASI